MMADSAISHRALIDWLLNPRSYADTTARVELVETHISWVFLTDRQVYKLKKPVRFEFLDFSDVARRHAACASELELNRRLAPEVYQDVVPITRDSRGNFAFAGEGETVDWVVKMKRLPAEQALDRLIARQAWSDANIAALATTLAEFYSRLKPVAIDPIQYLRDIGQHVQANGDELAQPQYGFDAWRLRRLLTAQKRFLVIAREMLEQRVEQGRIVEGHGDLRPEHIYFAPTPKIIDCLEFNRELRTVDVADELAFLAMECDRLGAAEIGSTVLQRHAEANADHIPAELNAFFKCYRACVRAKVQALRSKQVDGADAARLLDGAKTYLDQAAEYADWLGPPALVIVRGLSGTGKSTIAEALATASGAVLLQTDALRDPRHHATGRDAEYNSGPYSAERRRQVYDKMLQLAEEPLAQGISVVLDGTFLGADLRGAAVALGERHQAAVLIVRCTCPPHAAEERIRRRGTGNAPRSSDARPEFVARQQQAEEPDRPGWPVCSVDTTRPVEELCQEIWQRLRPAVLNESAGNAAAVACGTRPRDDGNGR